MKEEECSSDSDEYQDEEEEGKLRLASQRKRRKLLSGRAALVEETKTLTFGPLIDEVETGEGSFDDIIDRLLPEYLSTRAIVQEREVEIDQHGRKVRPLSRSEISSFASATIEDQLPTNFLEKITKTKLRLIRERRQGDAREMKLQASETVTRLSAPAAILQAHPQVIDALYSVKTTPYKSSFLSRLHGTMTQPLGVLAMDWETVSPWVNLMRDIREHHVLAHPTREHVVETLAPITYVTLQSCHLQQVHDLLGRSFWSGIDVSDSLDHAPERCTVVATYKRLVVGIAILSSPRETYITYLAVKAGWNNAGIARSMLYHLIMLNPHKDITLHVSVNSSAMLLYNQFGFKAEEFVAGFYEDYLDPQSRASKNAFKLRLRQQ